MGTKTVAKTKPKTKTVEPTDPSAAPKNKGGAPSKFTPERVQLILQAARAGAMTEDVIAGYGGITYTTLRVWIVTGDGVAHGDTHPERVRYREFSEHYKKARWDAEMESTLAIRQAAKDRTVQGKLIPGDWKAHAWWLERRRPADYGRPIRLMGATGGAVEVQTSNISNEDRAKRLAKLLKKTG